MTGSPLLPHLKALLEYADLAVVAGAWPKLPEVVRARISGIVEGASDES